MRSRYAAYAKREIPYLLRTLHPSHEDRAIPEAQLLRLLAEAAREQRYMGLAILDRRGPDEGGIAEVLFHARVFQRGKDCSFVERSEFAHDGTGWRYLRGDTLSVSKLAGDPQTLTLATFPKP